MQLSKTVCLAHFGDWRRSFVTKVVEMRFVIALIVRKVPAVEAHGIIVVEKGSRIESEIKDSVFRSPFREIGHVAANLQVRPHTRYN
jgi:hypothetical protein